MQLISLLLSLLCNRYPGCIYIHSLNTRLPLCNIYVIRAFYHHQLFIRTFNQKNVILKWKKAFFWRWKFLFQILIFIVVNNDTEKLSQILFGFYVLCLRFYYSVIYMFCYRLLNVLIFCILIIMIIIIIMWFLVNWKLLISSHFVNLYI